MSQDHNSLPPTRGEDEGQTADVAVRLARFLREMMVATWEGSVDGFDVEDLARKHKLLQQTTYDPAEHGPNDVGAEPGDIWFVIAPDVRAILRTQDHPPGGHSHEG